MTEQNQRSVQADLIVTKAIMDPADWGLYALCYMQVCAYCEVPPEQIEARANELNPPGTDGRWTLTIKGPEALDGTIADLSPVKCADDPARLHHMLSC